MLVYGDYSRSAEPKQVAGAAAFSLQLTCDQSVVKSDKLRLVVVFDYQLSRTPLRGRSDAYPCAKRLLQLLKCRARVWVHCGGCASSVIPIAALRRDASRSSCR